MYYLSLTRFERESKDFVTDKAYGYQKADLFVMR